MEKQRLLLNIWKVLMENHRVGTKVVQLWVRCPFSRWGPGEKDAFRDIS